MASYANAITHSDGRLTNYIKRRQSYYRRILVAKLHAARISNHEISDILDIPYEWVCFYTGTEDKIKRGDTNELRGEPGSTEGLRRLLGRELLSYHDIEA